ncbi:MAG: lipopolysaccharide heptosyltransferase II [Pirellulaceae bacterium]
MPNWIGDVVMATPTLRALRSHFSSAQMVGIMRPYVQSVLEGTNWLDDTILFDHRSKDHALGTRALVHQLRTRQLDSAIFLTNSLRPALVSWFAGIPQRIGYVRYGRAPLLTERLVPPRSGHKLQPVSAVDYYLEIAKSMGVDAPASRTPELAVLPNQLQMFHDICQSLALSPDRLITLNTGGAYGDAKSWPVTHFADLARRIATQHNVDIAIVCGPAERESAMQIERMAAHDRVRSLAQQTLSLSLTKSFVSQSRLLISTDSGPRHFGAAFGIPTLAIFGPTDPVWSFNYNPQETELRMELGCSPCAKRSCPLKHHACMQELTPDMVYRAALPHLHTLNRQAA